MSISAPGLLSLVVSRAGKSDSGFIDAGLVSVESSISASVGEVNSTSPGPIDTRLAEWAISPQLITDAVQPSKEREQRPFGLVSVTLAEAQSGKEVRTEGLDCPMLVRVPVLLTRTPP